MTKYTIILDTDNLEGSALSFDRVSTAIRREGDEELEWLSAALDGIAADLSGNLDEVSDDDEDDEDDDDA